MSHSFQPQQILYPQFDADMKIIFFVFKIAALLFKVLSHYILNTFFLLWILLSLTWNSDGFYSFYRNIHWWQPVLYREHSPSYRSSLGLQPLVRALCWFHCLLLIIRTEMCSSSCAFIRLQINTESDSFLAKLWKSCNLLDLSLQLLTADNTSNRCVGRLKRNPGTVTRARGGFKVRVLPSLLYASNPACLLHPEWLFDSAWESRATPVPWISHFYYRDL